MITMLIDAFTPFVVADSENVIGVIIGRLGFGKKVSVPHNFPAGYRFISPVSVLKFDPFAPVREHGG